LDHPLLIERKRLQRRKIRGGIRSVVIAGNGGSLGTSRSGIGAADGRGGSGGAGTAGVSRARVALLECARLVPTGGLVLTRFFLGVCDVEVLGLVLHQGSGEGLAFVEVGVDEGCGAFCAEDAL